MTAGSTPARPAAVTPDVSVIIPFTTAHPPDLVPFAAVVRDTGARRLWFGQTLDWDAAFGVAHLTGSGYRVPVGSAVELALTRHPADAAVRARTLAALTGHDTVLGVGPGTADLVRALNGTGYASPLGAMRDYLTVLRALVEGRTAAHDGEYFSLHGGLPPREHPLVALGVGVLGPRSAHLAGVLADVAITWMTPSSYVRDVLTPALHRGATDGGRPAPRVATVVHVALDGPGRDPYRLAWLATNRHLAQDNYAGMLRRAGLTLHPTSPAVGARALVDSGTFLTGSPADVVLGLETLARAGVDEVVLNTAGVCAVEGPAAAARDVRGILDALGRDARPPTHRTSDDTDTRAGTRTDTWTDTGKETTA